MEQGNSIKLVANFQMTPSHPRKVLFVHHFPLYSGAAESMLTLIRHLDPARYTASVLIVHPVAEPFLSTVRAMGIPAQHLPTCLVWDAAWSSRVNFRARAWRAFKGDPRIAEYLSTELPDIVHINEFVPVSIGVTAREMQIPVIWHCRHVVTHTRPVLDPGRRIIRTMEAIAEKIICISEAEAMLYSGSTTSVIYNPLDFSKANIACGGGAAVRKGLGINAEEYVITAPISLTTEKGAWDFIRACGIAAKLAPEIPMRFLLVGHLPSAGRRHLLRKWTGILGPRSPRVRANDLARHVGIEGRIKFTGFRKDIYEIMDGSDLIVFPSHLRACGRACFEAGAMSKPVLVTMPNKNTRVVLDGETGFILPEKDPETLGRVIVSLARDRKMGVDMGQAGYKHVQRSFDAVMYAKQMMTIYDHVQSGSGRKGLV